MVNICRCYCELGIARYKEYGKAADVHGNRRKTIVARNALCAFAILNDCSFDPSFRNIRALILSDTDFNVIALTIFDSFPDSSTDRIHKLFIESKGEKRRKESNGKVYRKGEENRKTIIERCTCFARRFLIYFCIQFVRLFLS